MSNLCLDLLIESGLMTSSGKAIGLDDLPKNEVSKRLSYYNNARIQSTDQELQAINMSDKLNALFSSGSTSQSYDSILSSSLVYDSIIIDDPLVTSSEQISFERASSGLKLFEWAFDLVRAGILQILPISFFNRPTNNVPFLISDDAFRSSIPKEIHNFIHDNATLKSVRVEEGSFLILSEDAYTNRRTALQVQFANDVWHSGVNLYLFETLQNCHKNEEGNYVCQKVWDPKGQLEKQQFDIWAYQSVNQAMRCRLKNIYNEICLAERIGHTYITESKFEAQFMAMAGENNCSHGSLPARFLKANNSFIAIDSPRTILELREKHSLAFDRFNQSLLSLTDELTGLDPEIFDSKAERLFQKEIMPQLDEIRDSAHAISSAAVKGVCINLSGIAAAIAMGNSMPFFLGVMTSASAGLSEAYPVVSQRERLKKRPAYIWHRITNKT